MSLLVREGRLVPVSAGTRLRADDDALVLADPAVAGALRQVFEEPAG